MNARSTHSIAEHLISHILRVSKNERKPFVLAIDGRSGTGKTTLASLLEDRLGALVVPGDDFFAGGVSVRDDPPSVLAQACIDWRSQYEVLKSLKNTGSAEYHPFDWGTFDGSKVDNPVPMKVQPIVVSEGVYSARPEMRELYDLLVLLEAPDDVRIRRLMEREGEISEWEKQWHRAEDWYFMNVSPREAFDIVMSERGYDVL